jgi:hypothetical protein
VVARGRRGGGVGRRGYAVDLGEREEDKSMVQAITYQQNHRWKKEKGERE